jgi:tetratricopeptide (TPR) repeat protein
MAKWHIFLSLVLLGLACRTDPPQESAVPDFQSLSGPYFGQKPPHGTAQLFMPGIITTHGRNGNITFLDDGKFCVFTSDETGTRYTYLDDGHWSTPQQVPWGRQRGLNDYTVGGDGKTFYWQSTQPTHDDDTVKDFNLWKSEWQGSQWTEPTPLPLAVNHPEFNEIYPTATADGTVYYFSSNRPDSLGTDIYVNRTKNDDYLTTERLPWPINSGYGEFDFIVAPDDSYFIFASSRPGGYGQDDNYICYRRDDGSWTHPINMGKGVNSYGNEIRSFVTHDRAVFFFGSTRRAIVPKGEVFEAEAAVKYGDNDVYWIDGSIISELENTAFSKTCAADIVRQELDDNGLTSAIVKLNELHGVGEESHRFSLFELLDICESLIEEDKADDAKAFYLALRETFDPFRIQHGYAQILSRHGQLERAISLMEELDNAGEEIDLQVTLIYFFYDLKARGNVEDAITALKASIERFPDVYHPYCHLARLYESKGELSKAKEACAHAIELNPDFTDAREVLERLNSKSLSE